MAVNEQKHPQENNDRKIVDHLLQAAPEPKNLMELARLRIRYKNFPGAKTLQRDLDLVLQHWYLSEKELFEQTRALYANGAVQVKNADGEQQDWS